MTINLRLPSTRPASAHPLPQGEPAITVRLRSETRPDHEAIEANPRMSRLMADDLTLPDYAAILRRMAAFHEPAEQGLRPWVPRFPERLEIEARLIKTALTHRDLSTLDIDDRETDRFPVIEFETLEAAWGYLYVVEGSTLGGQIIARQLHRSIGVTRERGAACHTPYGPQTGLRWQVFKTVLTEEVDRGALDPDAIIAGARAAFAMLGAWMSAERD